MPKMRVGLLFGGRSVEHEVSLASASSILQALDPARYEVALIGIDHEGHWHLGSRLLPPEVTQQGAEVTLPAVPGGARLIPTEEGGPAASVDVILPIVHGRGGEDGALQGLLELAGVPYVGSGVLGSAVQMDKDVAKRLLAAADLPVVPWQVVQGSALAPERRKAAAELASRELGLPVFVKPANSGSSVGTSRAADLAEIQAAIGEAARYDTKVLIERAVDAREIEVAVIGNDLPEASIPGEISANHEFYDYEAKYVDESTELIIPANLSEPESDQIRALACRAFSVLEARGLARVDFLLDKTSGELFINELNSLPGFTESSMFPRLWEATGLSYSALLDRLIELAIERHEVHARLETTYRRGG